MSVVSQIRERLEQEWRTRLKGWKPTDQQRERLKLAGYTGFFVLATILFLLVHLPRAEIAEAVGAKISSAIGRRVQADEVSLYGLSGLEFENLRIERKPSGTMTIPWQSIQVALIPYLFGNTNLTLKTRTDPGEAVLKIRQSSDELLFNMDLEKFAPGSFFPEKAEDGFSLTGTITGTLEYKAPGIPGLNGPSLMNRLVDPSDTEAHVEFTLKDGAMQGLSISGFPVPRLRYEQARIALDLSRDGQLTIKEFTLSGPDAALVIQGSATMSAPVSRSNLNLRIKLTPQGEFKEQYGMILGSQFRAERDGSFTGFLKGPAISPSIQR